MDIFQTVHIIEVLEGFLELKRPPEDFRNQLDLGYKIEGNSVFMLEIRPSYMEANKILEHEIAKTTYIKSKDHWKIFWMRADLKWHSYEPHPIVKDIKGFVAVVSKDEYGCFWG